MDVNKSPIVSVIVPVYKTENFIRRCVDSILNQSFPNFELILVDDGSPDNCPEICDEYEKTDDRIRVIHKINGGLSDARNVGYEFSRGEWITFIDSDDWIHKDYLDILYHACIDNNVELSMCGYIRTNGSDVISTKTSYAIDIETPENVWCNNPLNDVVSAWCKLYHRDICEGIKFPFGKLNEDAYTIYKYIFRCTKIAIVNAELYYYYQNPEGITGQKWHIKKMDSIGAFREQIEFFQNKNLKNAKEASILKYFDILEWHLIELKNHPEYKKIYQKTIKEMRKMLIREKETISKRESSNYIYHKYFPIRTTILSHFTALIHKINGGR